MTITFLRAALLFVALVAVLLPSHFAIAQNPVSSSSSTANDQQDPVVCFDQTLRNAVDAVQAYPAYLPSLWQQARQCRGRDTAQLDACWTTLMEAGPLIQRAGQVYELARHSGTQAEAEPLDREGQALMAQAEGLVIDAETCFKPIFQAWTQGNGGQHASRAAGTCQTNIPPGWIIVTSDQASSLNLRNCQPCGGDTGRFVCEPPTNGSPGSSASPPGNASGNGCPSLLVAARAAAASIEAGNRQPDAMLNLNKAVQQCPPGFPRPVGCHDMMVDAQSKLWTNLNYARSRAQQALACYEGHITEARGTPPTSPPSTCGDLPGYATTEANGQIVLHCGVAPETQKACVGAPFDVRADVPDAAPQLRYTLGFERGFARCLESQVTVQNLAGAALAARFRTIAAILGVMAAPGVIEAVMNPPGISPNPNPYLRGSDEGTRLCDWALKVSPALVARCPTAAPPASSKTCSATALAQGLSDAIGAIGAQAAKRFDCFPCTLAWLRGEAYLPPTNGGRPWLLTQIIEFLGRQYGNMTPQGPELPCWRQSAQAKGVPGSMSPAGIEQEMAAAGDGAKGFVFILDPMSGEVGHVFGVENQGGVVRFWDEQQQMRGDLWFQPGQWITLYRTQ